MPRAVGLLFGACTLGAFYGTRSVVVPTVHSHDAVSLRGEGSIAFSPFDSIRRLQDDAVVNTAGDFTCADAVNKTCARDMCACAVEKEVKGTLSIVLEWAGIVFLVMLSGLFSGLTLGLLSLDLVGLEVVIGGDPASQDAQYARKIRPVRQKGNMLLCTLLLGNVLVNSALSILLASYTGGLVGLLVSTMVIVIFGEIIPQAFCSRHALSIGALSLPVVKMFMVLLSPIAWPISKGLDYALGDEIGSIYSSNELSKLLDLHVKHNMIHADQARMMGGALALQDKFVNEVMTPVDNMFAISVHATLDFEQVSQIFKSGFSRIPVFDKDKNDVVGLLLTKDLIVIDPADSVSVHALIQFFGRTVHWLWPDSKLTEALALFKSGRAHLAMVRGVVNDVQDRDPYYVVKGIITLEDIVEELIQDEIVDEYDLYVDVEDKNTGLEDRLKRATFDYARLRLFDSKHSNQLSTEEADAVVAHVSTNVSYIKDGLTSGALTYEQLRSVVRSAPVVFVNGPDTSSSVPGFESKSAHDTVKEAASASAANPTDAAVAASVTAQMSGGTSSDGGTMGRLGKFHLFKRGVVTRHCVLILSGKVRIEAGKEGFVSEKGPWTVLGSQCLSETPGTYAPDFSAIVEDKGVRVLLLDAGLTQAATATAAGEKVVVRPEVVQAAQESALLLAASSTASAAAAGGAPVLLKIPEDGKGPEGTPPNTPPRSPPGGPHVMSVGDAASVEIGGRGPDPRNEEYRDMSRSKRMELFRAKAVGSSDDPDADADADAGPSSSSPSI